MTQPLVVRPSREEFHALATDYTVVPVWVEVLADLETPVAAFAKLAGFDILQLCIPLTLAASCAFMLPMGTPPNAIVFSSGFVSMGQMARAGLVLNIIGIILISFFGIFFL